MKTYIFLSALLLCGIFATTSHAQTNYYTTTRVIQGNGYSYQCDSDGGIVDLYNSSYRLRETNQTRNGVWIDIDAFYDQNEPYNWMTQRRQAQDLAYGIFTAAERNSFKSPAGQFISIGMYINPQTGIVQEVDYTFSERFNYAKVPVERYRQIELAIKNNVTFPITAAEKQLNYVFTWFHFDPNLAPLLSIPVLSMSETREGSAIYLVFTVDNPQPDVSYEWELNGTIVARSFFDFIRFLSPFRYDENSVQTYNIGSGSTVRCRAYRDGKVSGWSQPVSTFIRGLTLPGPEDPPPGAL